MYSCKFARLSTLAASYSKQGIVAVRKTSNPWAKILLTSEVVHCHRILEQRVIPRDYGDAAIGDKVAGAVGLGVVANRGAFGQVDVAVDNAAADAAMASHGHMREQNG